MNTTKAIKVAVWDDRSDQLAALLNGIRAGVDQINDVEVIDRSGQIAECVEELKRRFETNDASPFPGLDDIDVLCIDYDLRMLKGQTWLTADVLAGLVRAYSDCPCVVAMNRPPRVAFDLTMMAGWEGPGDVQALPAALFRESFWRTKSDYSFERAFRPWSWFDLRDARSAMKQRIAEMSAIDDIADADIFTFFGFDKEEILNLSWRSLGALSSKVRSEDPRLSFSEFLADGARSLPPEKMLEIKLDDNNTRPIALRILAFELGRWLNEQVVAGQDVLVDIPHLLSRAPWLVSGDRSKLETWNSTLRGDYVPIAWLEEHRFQRSAWLNNATYVWSKTQADTRFIPVSNQDATDASVPTYGNFVFLEDSSCFVAAEFAQDYNASFGNIWDQRYVRRSDAIETDLPYGPLVRFAI